MKGKKYYLLLVVIGVLIPLFLIPSCPGALGHLPFYMDNYRTAKFQIHPDAPAHPTRVALYIDAERYTPLNALYYVLEDGTQFFDYVILGSLELRKGEEGLFIYTPPGLARLLDGASTHIRPLRAAGIKVLLGLRGGHAGVTFSSIDALDLPIVLEGLEAIMHANWLDGFEIWDIDGADIAREWDDGFPYPSGWHRLADGTYYQVDLGYGDEELYSLWFGQGPESGGQRMSDFILALRAQLLGGAAQDGIVGGDIEQFIIISREENHGAWLLNDPPSGTFTVLFEHLNFTVNPNPAYFGSRDGWGIANFPGDSDWFRGGRRAGRSVLYMHEGYSRYGPLAVEFNPQSSRLIVEEESDLTTVPPLVVRPTTVVPPIVATNDDNDNDIFSFTLEFFRGDFYPDPSDEYSTPSGYSMFGMIHYRGLRPVSLAAADDVLRITQEEWEELRDRMKEKRVELGLEEFFDEEDIVLALERAPCGTRLTQAGYMSITSLFLFGQRVEISREGGGNHRHPNPTR